MEPRREESQKALEPSAEPKRKRFRIVKLEERIAPKKGGKGTNNCPPPVPTADMTCVGTCMGNVTCDLYSCGW